MIRMMTITLLFGSLMALADNKPNCKLTIRSYSDDGNTKLKIEEVYAPTRKACKKEAKARQKIDDPEEFTKIKVSFSWQKPKGQ